MINLIKLFAITFLTFQPVYAQTWEVKISGNLLNADNSQVSEIPVVLFQNEDTVIAVKTDKAGTFVFHTTFTHGNEYRLRIQDEMLDYRSREIMLYQKEDLSEMSEYQVELEFPKIIRDKFDNSAYYNLNQTTSFENFEAAWLKGYFDQFPGMCIEFVQTINPAEKEETARKRMEYFREELLKNGFDLSRISFRTDIFVLRNDQLKEDPRSRIQGVILSMNGDCENK